ncbi:MAG: pyrroloquinoline quinone biosynthesis protein PqqB [Pseudomonadota bacterium]
MGLRSIILGAAAGGGLPQWNCACPNCAAARSGEIPPQTQSSLAVSVDGTDWALLNASPDIGLQLRSTPALHPSGQRTIPVSTVLLTNGDIDHVAGLLTLREKTAFRLVMTPEIASVIAANPIFSALDSDLVARVEIGLDEDFDLLRGLTARLFPVPGKVPLYMEGAEANLVTDLEGEQTVGVELSDGAARAYYIPGCARLTSRLRERLEGADLLFFDGTLWTDDEMIRLGLGKKTGGRMGHISMSGATGSIEAFKNLDIGRKIFVHMNNSNPVLNPAAPERREAEAAGWEIGQDGMAVSI